MTQMLLAPDLLYDGGLAPPKSDQAIVLDDGRIVEVGPLDDVATTRVQPIRVAGTLMPGLIDCHTHLALSASADPARTLKDEPRTRTVLRAVRHLAQHLIAGVTTIRDLGAPDGTDLELMRAQAEGLVAGPRVVAAGRLIAMTGGHACYLGVEADGAVDVARAVRAQVKAGAAVIKVVATGGVISLGVDPGAVQLSLDELRAAVIEAHHAGRRVAAHAQGTEGIRNALLAGTDSVEHGFWLDEECAARMNAQGTHLVATFAAAQAMLDHLDELPGFMREKMARVGGAHRDSFLRALKAGVSLATGTDAGTPFNEHGTLAREIALHVQHGASTVQALHAATGSAAALLGRDDIGVIARGKIADLIAVAGDPHDDLAALSRVHSVWQSGRTIDLSSLRSLISTLMPSSSERRS